MCHDESVKYACGCFRAFDYYPCEFEGNQAGYCARTSSTRIIDEICHEHELKGRKRIRAGPPLSRTRTSWQASSTSQRSREQTYLERRQQPTPLGSRELSAVDTCSVAQNVEPEIRRTEPERRDAATLINQLPVQTRETPASSPPIWRLSTPSNSIWNMLTPFDRARIHPTSHNPLISDPFIAPNGSGFHVISIPPRPGVMNGAVGRLGRGEERALKGRRDVPGPRRGQKDYLCSVSLYIILPVTVIGLLLWPKLGPLCWFIWNLVDLTKIFDRNLLGRMPISPVRYGQPLSYIKKESAWDWMAILTILFLLPALTASYFASTDFLRWLLRYFYPGAEENETERITIEGMGKGDEEEIVVPYVRRVISKAHGRLFTRPKIIYFPHQDSCMLPEVDQPHRLFEDRTTQVLEQSQSQLSCIIASLFQRFSLPFLAAAKAMVLIICAVFNWTWNGISATTQVQLITLSIAPWILITFTTGYIGKMWCSQLLSNSFPDWESKPTDKFLPYMLNFALGAFLMAFLTYIYRQMDGHRDSCLAVDSPYRPWSTLIQFLTRTVNQICSLSCLVLDAIKGWGARAEYTAIAYLLLFLLWILASAWIGAFPAIYAFRILTQFDPNPDASDDQWTAITSLFTWIFFFRCVVSFVVFSLCTYIAFVALAGVLFVLYSTFQSILSGTLMLWQRLTEWLLWWPTPGLACGIYGARFLGWRWENVYLTCLILMLLKVFITSNFPNWSSKFSYWIHSLRQIIVNRWYEPRTVLIHPEITKSRFPVPINMEEVKYDAGIARRSSTRLRSTEMEHSPMERRVTTPRPVITPIGKMTEDLEPDTNMDWGQPHREDRADTTLLNESRDRERAEIVGELERNARARGRWNTRRDLVEVEQCRQQDLRSQVSTSTPKFTSTTTSRSFRINLGGSRSAAGSTPTTVKKRVRFHEPEVYKRPTVEDVDENGESPSTNIENLAIEGAATPEQSLYISSSSTLSPYSTSTSPYSTSASPYSASTSPYTFPPYPASATLGEASLTPSEITELNKIRESYIIRQRGAVGAGSSVWSRDETAALETLAWCVYSRQGNAMSLTIPLQVMTPEQEAERQEMHELQEKLERELLAMQREFTLGDGTTIREV